MEKTLGGDRLGSGNKMTVDLHNYGRSTHNLSRAFRSSMSCGTLVPFFNELCLPGDTFDIDTNTLVKTLPTLGPLFGSFKLQTDFFCIPIRLYNRVLHNNVFGAGLEMDKVLFPMLYMQSSFVGGCNDDPNARQISSSSLAAYLGLRGLGKPFGGVSDVAVRYVNAIPFLGYYEIFANYYSNKQEGIGYVMKASTDGIKSTCLLSGTFASDSGSVTVWSPNFSDFFGAGVGSDSDLYANAFFFDFGSISLSSQLLLSLANSVYLRNNAWAAWLDGSNVWQVMSLSQLEDNGYINITNSGNLLSIRMTSTGLSLWAGHIVGFYGSSPNIDALFTTKMESFNLTEISDMRDRLLMAPSTSPFIIGDSYMPYSAVTGAVPEWTGFNLPFIWTNSIADLSGLCMKTYLSDRFNNWLSTEWVDGMNGINEISRVDVSSGSFTIDALNLAHKVFNILNRIAISGGSYNDWQEAVWGEKFHSNPEVPYFIGGNSQEISFTEVTSTSKVDADNPLGTLAGKGYSLGESRHIHFNVDEPCFIMGICSITPRIDYSQGNRWYINLKSMDDLHKPGLDGIGFQELITDEFVAWDSLCDNLGGTQFNSIGKQPAWIHYMTAVNECFGSFAKPNQEMYMTLNRNYEADFDQFGQPTLSDGTTYIDPKKFNNNFARIDLAAQNFWVQIGIDCEARRKISAKQIPNL